MPLKTENEGAKSHRLAFAVSWSWAMQIQRGRTRDRSTADCMRTHWTVNDAVPGWTNEEDEIGTKGRSNTYAGWKRMAIEYSGAWRNWMVDVCFVYESISQEWILYLISGSTSYNRSISSSVQQTYVICGSVGVGFERSSWIHATLQSETWTADVSTICQDLLRGYRCYWIELDVVQNHIVHFLIQ